MERYAAEPDFQAAWRRFARACNHLLPDPPHEAKEWIAAADEYDAGRLGVEQLTAVREQMSNIFLTLFDAATVEQRAALVPPAIGCGPDSTPTAGTRRRGIFSTGARPPGSRRPYWSSCSARTSGRSSRRGERRSRS
jgi:hypothetical protein